jgi:ATP-dependent protease ClpP protease subunit
LGVTYLKSKNDLFDLFKPPINQNQRVITKQAVNIHEFYLSGDVEGSEEYIEWFDIIRSASQNDVIKIYINSPGGDLFTAIQFMRVLTETDAQVVISIEGACMSAATLIFMCGHQYEISPHSVFMFHNYSSGMAGKGGEMFDRMAHERIWSEKLFQDVYADFLNEREIKSILDNKDLWMDSDEVIKRLKKKIKKNENVDKSNEEG